jgi:hypothetical protein
MGYICRPAGRPSKDAMPVRDGLRQASVPVSSSPVGTFSRPRITLD